MAPRPFWKGYLKLSLVTCPVAMMPATSDRERLKFHTVNRATGNRVRSRYVDAVTGKAVRDTDEVRGYAVAEDEYVLLEDDELDAVALESARTIDIETFVPRDEIGWIYLDAPHYLTPDDKVGEEAFSVIRDAMASTGTVGVARLVLYRRERAVMLAPSGKGIVVWTLRYGDEVRDAQAYFDGIDTARPDARPLKLVKQLIGERSRGWDPDMLKDPVQDRLKEIIAAKKKKRPAKTAGPEPEAPPEPDGGKVVSIMDALRKSVSAETAKKRR